MSRLALHILRLLVAASLTLGTAGGQQPATPPADSETVSPEERTRQQEETAKQELAAARSRLEAAPDAMPEEVRRGLEDEVDRLQRLGLLLGQSTSLFAEVAEELERKAELEQSLARMKATGPEETRPFSFLKLDEIRSELALETQKRETREAAVRSAQNALATAREDKSEAERERLVLRESAQANTDPQAAGSFDRSLRLATLDERIAEATVGLRERELALEKLSLENQELRVAILEEKRGWYEREAKFTEDDLREAISRIKEREAAIQRRQEDLRFRLSYLEPELIAAQRRRESSPGPEIDEEVAARRLAREVIQQDLNLLAQELQRKIEARQVWERRFQVEAGEVTVAEREEWIDASRQATVDLDRQIGRHRNRVTELRRDLVALQNQPAEGGLGSWRAKRMEALQSLIQLREQAIAELEAHLRLHEWFLARIERRGLDLGERLGALWRGVLEVWSYPLVQLEDSSITVGKVVLGLFLLLAGWTLSRRLSAILGRAIFPRLRMDEGVAAAVQSALFYILLFTFVLFALRMVNIPLTVFTVLGGAFAIGFGFGSQNIVKNFISGLILLAERPIRVRDLIQVGDLYGLVEHIGARSTRVRTGDNLEILVPNSSFLESNVVNWTLSEKTVRIKVNVGVAYGSPPREVSRLLRKAVDEHGLVAKKPTPIVLFDDFGDNALLFSVHFWIHMRTMMDRRTIESDIRFRIENLLREANIVIAFPQRDVHLDTLRPLEIRMAPQRDEESETENNSGESLAARAKNDES